MLLTFGRFDIKKTTVYLKNVCFLQQLIDFFCNFASEIIKSTRDNHFFINNKH